MVYVEAPIIPVNLALNEKYDKFLIMNICYCIKDKILKFQLSKIFNHLPVSELMIPFRIKKSIVTGQLVVFISGWHKREGN